MKLAGLVEILEPILREYHAKQVAQTGALTARIAALEAQVAALEGRAELKYCGVWREAQAYPAAALVTFAGSLWYATEPSAGAKPGNGKTCWTLALKRGDA